LNRGEKRGDGGRLIRVEGGNWKGLWKLRVEEGRGEKRKGNG